MGEPLQMPERTPGCGSVAVQNDHKGRITINVTQDGVIHAFSVSEYNAWRLFGMLALMLGLPLSKAVGKAIKL